MNQTLLQIRMLGKWNMRVALSEAEQDLITFGSESSLNLFNFPKIKAPTFV